MPANAIANWISSRIDKWRELARDGTDEANTERSVVDPLLQQLGWDTSCPEEVQVQYPVGSEKVDYALKNESGAPLVFIEAKQIAQTLDAGIESNVISPEKYREQLLATSAKLLVLTNGLQYRFLVRTGEEGAVWCAALAIDLSEDSQIKDVGALEALRKTRIFDDSGLTWFNEAAASQGVVDELRKLFETPTEELLDLLAKETGGSVGVIAEILGLMADSVPGSVAPEELVTPQAGGAPELARVRTKMTGQVSYAKRWRKKAAKYIEVWRAFLRERNLTKEQVISMIQGRIKGKGHGAFFTAYGTPQRTPLMVKMTDDPESALRINPGLLDLLEDSIRLMEEEMD